MSTMNLFQAAISDCFMAWTQCMFLVLQMGWRYKQNIDCSYLNKWTYIQIINFVVVFPLTVSLPHPFWLHLNSVKNTTSTCNWYVHQDLLWIHKARINSEGVAKLIYGASHYCWVYMYSTCTMDHPRSNFYHTVGSCKCGFHVPLVEHTP